MKRERVFIRAVVVFALALFALAFAGLGSPVDMLPWYFWSLLATVVVGLLASLILVLFHDSFLGKREDGGGA